MTKANVEMKLSKLTADKLGKQAEVIKIALEHQQAIDNKHMLEGPKRPTMFIYRTSMGYYDTKMISIVLQIKCIRTGASRIEL